MAKAKVSKAAMRPKTKTQGGQKIQGKNVKPGKKGGKKK